MWEKLWDFFVDALIVLFMPLVCSYFTLSSNLYFNVSIRDATGLGWASNTLLTPVQYLLAGQEAIQKPDGKWEFKQRFDYRQGFWIKTAGSIIALPSSFILGSVAKALSFFSKEHRDRFFAVQEAKRSTQIDSHLDDYRKMGLQIDEITEMLTPLGCQRRPGDEKTLAIEKKAMKNITALFNEAKIPWWIDCGTCLGAYRYGGVIPWDGDIDLAVLQDDFDNIFHVLNKLDSRQYIVQDWSTRDLPKSFIKVYIRESGTAIDIYHFAIHPETKELRYIFSLETQSFFPEWFKVRERRFKVPVPFQMLFPLKKMVFDGLDVFVPHDTKKYLQRCYGENLDPVKIYNAATGYYEKDLSHPYWLRSYAH